MPTFERCMEMVKCYPSFNKGATFEGIEFFTVELDVPVTYKARTSAILTVTRIDSNAEFEYLERKLKVLKIVCKAS